MDTKLIVGIVVTLLTFLLKGVLLKWFTGKLVDMFDVIIKRLLKRYPEELSIWLHHTKKRKGKGHQYPNPLRCQDEDCQFIHVR